MFNLAVSVWSCDPATLSRQLHTKPLPVRLLMTEHQVPHKLLLEQLLKRLHVAPG
ncbi:MULTISPECIES: hypothetical protein [Photorhabdus]|uniref:hypothetical protein n=1 Tax=Photorhabdus TaxID=29487 RepID=UPI001E561F2F|nr:hypothetical protein [Photorhabdus thracensis]